MDQIMYNKNNHSVRCGATTVEFAACLVILMMMLFGGFEFSRISIVRHSVDNAAYEAARHIIVPGGY